MTRSMPGASSTSTRSNQMALPHSRTTPQRTSRVLLRACRKDSTSRMSCAGPDPAGHPDVRVHRRAQPPLATTLVVTETSMSTATAQTSLVFDQANRLRTYGSSATYTYDGDGLRQSKTVGGVNEPFVWDASAGI